MLVHDSVTLCTFDVVLDGVLLEVLEELVLDEAGRRHHHRLHHLKVQNMLSYFYGPKLMYRVTIQLVANLPLTSKQKFCFGLAWPGLARPKRNLCSEVNGRFATS